VKKEKIAHMMEKTFSAMSIQAELVRIITRSTWQEARDGIEEDGFKLRMKISVKTVFGHPKAQHTDIQISWFKSDFFCQRPSELYNPKVNEIRTFINCPNCSYKSASKSEFHDLYIFCK
jgi:hypothetical protein